jgi:hypothetical protein
MSHFVIIIQVKAKDKFPRAQTFYIPSLITYKNLEKFFKRQVLYITSGYVALN